MSNTFQGVQDVNMTQGYARPRIELPEETYVPSRDNPQENVRPGADDHKKHRSLNSHVMAVYKDRSHP